MGMVDCPSLSRGDWGNGKVGLRSSRLPAGVDAGGGEGQAEGEAKPPEGVAVGADGS